MQRNTHIAFGLLITIILYSIIKFDIGYAVFAGFGAIFPDFDFKKEIRHLHRKLLHNIWAIGIATIIIMLFLSFYAGVFFMVGAISHLIADSLTPMGIYPLYPKLKPFLCYNSKFKISTGRLSEKNFAIIIFILSIGIFFIENIKDILSFIILIVMVFIMFKKYLPQVYRK